MQVYDVDHDGQLTADEIKVFTAADATNAKTAMTFDINHNGILESTEIDAWRNSIDDKSVKSGSGTPTTPAKKKSKSSSSSTSGT